VLLGLGNMSPGLSEFGSKIGRRGIATTVSNYGGWQALAQDAIAQYKRGRLRSIMIVGHSLGGSAAMAMAAELGQAGVPVALVATLDAVGEPEASANVRRSVNIRPKDGEDHFSVIAAQSGLAQRAGERGRAARVPWHEDGLPRRSCPTTALPTRHKLIMPGSAHGWPGHWREAGVRRSIRRVCFAARLADVVRRSIARCGAVCGRSRPEPGPRLPRWHPLVWPTCREPRDAVPGLPRRLRRDAL
jgi:pimeloyl-ACP methyl ester carboxylesterase